MIQCIFEQGRPASLRHVTVGAIVVNEKREVLLVKRAVSHNFGKYTIPGGFLDRNEDTRQGTLRELKEETGYEGEIRDLFCVNDSPNRPKEDRQNVDFLYLVTVTGGKITMNNEVSEIRWFTEEQLPSDDQFAFDHRKWIMAYFRYLETPFTLPILSYEQ